MTKSYTRYKDFIKFKNYQKSNLIILAICLLPIIFSIIYVFYFSINVVIWDQWEVVVIINKIINGTFNFSDLLKPLNEHIMFFPYIFMILLAFLTKYNNIVEMYIILILLITCLFILYLYFKRVFTFKKVGFWFVPIPFLILNLRQYENMLNGFQLTWLLTLTFSLLTFYLIFILKETKREIITNAIFINAIFCGTIASYSTAMGLFVWPAVIFQILIMSIKKGKKIFYTIILFFTGLFEWILYIFLTLGRIHVDFKSIIFELIRYLKHFFTLIGNSVYGNPYGNLIQGNPYRNFLLGNSYISFIIGALIITTIIISIVLIKKNNRLKNNSFPIAILIFSLLTILSITKGRALHSGTLYPSRYTTFTILLVLSLFIMIIDLNIFTRSNFSKILKVILTVIIVINIPISYYEGLIAGEKHKAHWLNASFILSTYNTQPVEVLGILFPSGEMIKKYAPVLKKLGYNVFSEKPMFPEFSSNLKLNESEYLMHIENIEMEPLLVMEKDSQIIYINLNSENSFIEINGWAVDPEAGKAASGLYIEIDDKLYPAYYGIERKDIADSYKNKAYRYSGFVRYLPLSDIESGMHDVSVKVISNDEKSYYNGESFKLYLPASEEKADINSSSFVIEDNSRYRINVDEYESDSTISGSVVIKGWVIDQKSIYYKGKVTILFYDGPGLDDKKYIGIADYYLPRPDVVKAFNTSEYILSGFELSINTTKLESGDHDIYIYALNEDGVYSKQLFKLVVDN